MGGGFLKKYGKPVIAGLSALAIAGGVYLGVVKKSNEAKLTEKQKFIKSLGYVVSDFPTLSEKEKKRINEKISEALRNYYIENKIPIEEFEIVRWIRYPHDRGRYVFWSRSGRKDELLRVFKNLYDVEVEFETRTGHSGNSYDVVEMKNGKFKVVR